jgi:cysteine desulfurase/selenocysteine lyase
MYAPMGIGVLYGKEKYLDALPPYQTGGEMIKEVTFEKTTYNELPLKFEAGTPNVEGVYGLNAAIHYIQNLGLKNIDTYEKELLHYATEKLIAIEGLRIIGQSDQKASLISFILDGIHHFDAGTIIDKMGIAVRTGHHCAMPLMEWFKISGTLRASFSFYNTFEEIDRLVEAILKVKQLFG